MKYPGYISQKNGNLDLHIRKLMKKANVAIILIWGIVERKFKNNFTLRMFLFDRIGVSLAQYAAE